MLIANGLLATPAFAGDEGFGVYNERDYAIRVCFFDNSHSTWLRPLECVKLKKGRFTEVTIRDAPSKLKVRVLRDRKLVDKELCTKKGVSSLRQVIIGSPCIRIKNQPFDDEGNMNVERDTVGWQVWEPGSSVLVNREGDPFWHHARIVGRWSRQSTRFIVDFSSDYREVIEGHYIAPDRIKAGSSVLLDDGARPGSVVLRDGNTLTVRFGRGQRVVSIKEVRVTTSELEF
ncbi:MAG: hypothetical protein AAFY19_04100 [Pseudomonadota bacterium]